MFLRVRVDSDHRNPEEQSAERRMHRSARGGAESTRWVMSAWAMMDGHSIRRSLMLLTITTEHAPATDLGYLLHKHPENVRTVTFPFGDAHVFFPEAADERCTAAVLVEVDPVGLIRRRGRRGKESF